jgi:O-antigen/teichoic acid export membrane protein
LLRNARATVKISHNVLINFGGAVLSTAIALVTIPRYLRLIGDARFGVLAIVWLLLSYFGLFEMGLGRATSKYIAELHDATIAERESLFWTVLAVNASLGVAGGLVLWVLGRSLLGVVGIPPAAQPEVISAMPWIAAAVPLATVVSVLIGALEGRERFLSLNLLQVSGGCVFQVIPLIVAYVHGPDLRWLIASSVVSRAVVSVPMILTCRTHVPLRNVPRIEMRWIPKLFAFGSWITISGVINPILVTLDRLLIGVMRGVAAVTYYTVPFNLGSKFLLLPDAIARTLFPRFSMQDDYTARDLARSAVLIMAIITTPINAVALVLMKPFLTLWLGIHLANLSAQIGEILLVGMWANGLAYVPSGYLQARGKPHINAKFHLIEAAPFVGLLWLGLRLGGVEGAAFVWCLRVLADFLLLSGAAGLGWRMAASLIVPGIALVTCAVAAWLIPDLMLLRLILIVFALTVCAIWAWVAAPLELRAYLRRSKLAAPEKIPLGVA